MAQATSSPKIYPSIGRCIYCFTKTNDLTNEHIIPYGLEGNWVFLGASCKVCEKKTGAVESKCLSDMLYSVRRNLNFRSRKPKRQKTVIHAPVIDSSGKHERRAISVSEFPGAIFMFRLGRPDVLWGRPPKETFEAKPWWSEKEKGSLGKFLASNDLQGIGFGKMQPFVFSRMLAKIAHSYAVAEKGLDSFVPMLPLLILEGIKCPSYYVGGNFAVPPAELEILHWIKLRELDGFLVAHIRLFAFLGAPVYHVVVGSLVKTS